MITAEIIHVLTNLAKGIDPLTGADLPSGGPYHNPYVIRALFAAADELQEHAPARSFQRSAPANAGRAWTPEEDDRLLAELGAGTRLMDIARAHHRSRGAILTRLVRLGKFATLEDARAATERPRQTTAKWAALKLERTQAGKPWCDAEDEALLEDFDAGLPLEQIAKGLHRGVRAIEVRLIKLGRQLQVAASAAQES